MIFVLRSFPRILRSAFLVSPLPIALYCAALPGLLLPEAARAQEQRQQEPQQTTPKQEIIVMQRIGGPVELDGLSFEPAWQSVEPYVPSQYEPNNGAPPTERTEMRIAYNEEYLFLSLRAYDREPEGIRANTLYRDRLSSDDHFEILIDSYNDNETGMLFNSNPRGHRREAAISNDASGGGIASGGWINVDFNTYWDVETVIADSGWFSEMRIPFSSLRFQPREDGTVIMGLTLQRKIVRKDERVVFPPVERISGWAFLKPSLAQKFLLEGIESDLPIYVTGYGLGGAGETARQEEAVWGYDRDVTREIGADLKYQFANNATLDLTLNTDFAQVEADDQQINLTRFSLFFPEKRQFFQERAGIFDFRTGGLSRLFHSRRIGLTANGAPVPILGGARGAGRFGQWDVGALAMQTASSGEQSSENFGVLRLRRKVFNPWSYAGAMGTSRIGADGAYNFAYGLDGVFRLFGDDYLTLQWAHSFDDMLVERPDHRPLNGGRMTMQMERRRSREWEYRSILAWAGPDYDPGIGFSQRNDFTLVDNALSYTWLPPEGTRLIFHTFEMAGLTYLRNEDRSVESAQLGPRWSYGARNGTRGQIGVMLLYEDLLDSFKIGEVEIPAGSYTFWEAEVSYGESNTNRYRLGPTLQAGRFYDGWKVTASMRPTWYVSPHLEMTGRYEYSRIRFPDRNEGLHAHLLRFRIGMALNTQASANIFLQYNSISDALSSNIRLRYNFREGNDLWLVYNHGVNTARDRFDPAPPLTDNRTLLVKYTYTFQL